MADTDKNLLLSQPESGRISTASLSLAFALFLFAGSFSIAGSQIALGLSVVFMAVALARRPEKFVWSELRAVWIAILACLTWQVASSLLGNHPVNSVWSLREEWLFLAIPVAVYLFRRAERAERLVMVLAVGLLLISIYGVIQHFTGVHWFRDHPLSQYGQTARPAGNFSHPLTYGNYLVTGLMFGLGYLMVRFRSLVIWRRWLLSATVASGLVATAFLNSRGPMLAAVGGLVALGVFARKTRYVAIIIVGAALVAWISSPSLVDELAARLNRDLTPSHPLSRLYIWDHTLQIIGQHPITGVGAGNFSAEYDRTTADETEPHYPMGHAHSDYLNIAALYGIPGLLLYLGMWGAVLRRLYRTYRKSERTSLARGLALGALVATVAFAVASLTEAAFADEEVRQLLMALWGAGLAATLLKQTDRE